MPEVAADPGTGDAAPEEACDSAGSTSGNGTAGAAASADGLEPPADLGEFNDYDPTVPDPTPLPTDPDVRVGRLDNGLIYYLRSNDSPGDRIVLNLVVNAVACPTRPMAAARRTFSST